MNTLHPETLAIHAGADPDAATGALALPLILATTFERAADGSYPHGYVYARTETPNREALEAAVTALEGGAAAAAFASGSAAMMTALQALAPGDHVIVPNDLYHGIRLLLTEIFVPWGLQVSFVDMPVVQAVRAALRPNTRLLLVETPSNPLMQISDLHALAALAHAAGARLLCDNTMATPILQRPLALGADLVLHATTKYFGGHSDSLGGVLITREEDDYFARVRQLQKLGGAVLAPFDCWLTQRGIQTLPHRVRVHSENALRIAQFLRAHPAVERVLYAGLPDHPGHEIAARQMRLHDTPAFGGMLAFQVRGGVQEALAVAAKTQVFTRATSFGGTHSLIEHRASVEHPGTTTPQNLLRLSVGLEHIDDLTADLAAALA